MSSPTAPSTASSDSPRARSMLQTPGRGDCVLLFTASLINYFDRQHSSYALPICKDFTLIGTARFAVVGFSGPTR